MKFIAEIGVAHCGVLDIALEMISAAKSAGADMAKFQLFDADILGKPELKPLQLSRHDMLICMDYCASAGIEFLCTPFDTDNLLWLADQGVKRLKISSGGIFNRKLLMAAAATRLPIILSTGMVKMEEITNAMRIFKYTDDVTLLHCVSSYPLAPENANLGAIAALRSFGRPVGYSDHSANADVLLAATALGAEVIEAHMTLDRDQPGPDHNCSFEPSALAEAIVRCREVEKMIGNGIKFPQKCEMVTREAWFDQR